MNGPEKISVVIPVFNEEENVLPLAREIVSVLSVTGNEFEILFVNDASTDATAARIQEAKREFTQVRGISLKQRSGQTAAMLTGLRQADGEIIVTMDGDLQNDPHDIPALVARLQTCDVVCGYRARRQDSWARRIASRLANRVRNAVTHDGVRDTGCSLKAFRSKCINDLPPLHGMHRFMPAYFRLHGRAIEEMPVNHRPRTHGRSKYTNLKRLPTTLLDLFGFWWFRRRLIRTDFESGA